MFRIDNQTRDNLQLMIIIVYIDELSNALSRSKLSADIFNFTP